MGWNGRAWVWVVVAAVGQAQVPWQPLTDDTADHWASLALACVRQEFPNKLDHVLGGAEEARTPKVLHPAFYGCFDWHSSVHGHWMLVKLLREHPAMARAADIRRLLDEHLCPERMAAELAYLQPSHHRSFERTYGWAWLLKLAAEVESWEEPQAATWRAALRPLAGDVAHRFQAYLAKLTYPIRTGVHPNTAFSLDLALDYAQATQDRSFEAQIRARALAWFGRDRKAPLAWEPSGEDFLSPSLEEAALMARILPRTAFRSWLDHFLPGLPTGLRPAVVSDRTDPRIVHLDGLNLSRARALVRISAALGPADPRARHLLRVAGEHAEASLPFLTSGNYEGEHWLATFAVRLLSEPGPRSRRP
jgi:hypothetical protein